MGKEKDNLEVDSNKTPKSKNLKTSFSNNHQLIIHKPKRGGCTN
jgi:hypothetical protein